MLYLCVCPSVFAPAWFVLPLRVCSAFLFCMCFALRPCFAFTQTWHAFLFLIYWYTPTHTRQDSVCFLRKNAPRLHYTRVWMYTCDVANRRRIPCFFEGKLCPAITSTCAAGNKFTRKPLHTEAVTHRSLYTDKCYTKYLWGKKLLDTGTFAKAFANRKPLHTQKSLHTEAFTHRNLYTNTEEFTHRSRLHRNLCTEKTATTKNLCRKNCLDKGTFTDESVCKQKPLRAQKPLHAETVIHRSLQKEICYTKKRLQKEIFRIS